MSWLKIWFVLQKFTYWKHLLCGSVEMVEVGEVKPGGRCLGHTGTTLMNVACWVLEEVRCDGSESALSGIGY